jgi:putative membrane protein
MRALSVIWSVLKFGGFRLTRRDDDLRARYGLLTQISATIPRHRVQLLSTGSRPLERLCGRASVQVETAGGRSGGGEQDGAAVDHLWLAPLVRRQQVGVLLNEVFPEVPFDALDWQPLAPRARRRILVRGSAAALLVAGVAVAAVGPWGAVVAAVALPWAWIHARLWVRHTAWALTETAVVYRSGWWHRRLSVVRFNKVQALELRRSPFDRRHGMASVQVDTAGAGRSGHRIDIVYVALSAARAIVADISAAASRTAFRW